MSEETKQKVDKFLSKYLSRKLMVFIVSVGALFSGMISGDDWVILSTAYIGGQTIIDAVSKLRK